MKYRLPMLEERSVADAAAFRSEKAGTFERELLAKTPVTCHKGCDHCCHHPVAVSILEGISMHRWLVEHRMWSTALKAKFEDHHAKVYGLALSLWLVSAVPCPLLDTDGLCSAYEGRPSPCRMTFSIGDAFYCHPHRLPEALAVVPRREPLRQIADYETKILKQFKQQFTHLPLSTAVLIAEKINSGELNLRDYLDEVRRIETERGV